MLTKKDYCDWRTVKDLESLGMNVYTKVKGIDVFKSVLLYESQKFLRERHNLHITIYSQSQESWQYRITKPHQRLEDGLHGEDFVSYEDALINAIKDCIKYANRKRLLRL